MTRSQRALAKDFLLFTVGAALLRPGDRLDKNVSMNHGCYEDNVVVQRDWPLVDYEHAYHVHEMCVLVNEVRTIIVFQTNLLVVVLNPFTGEVRLALRLHDSPSSSDDRERNQSILELSHNAGTQLWA